MAEIGFRRAPSKHLTLTASTSSEEGACPKVADDVTRHQRQAAFPGRSMRHPRHGVLLLWSHSEIVFGSTAESVCLPTIKQFTAMSKEAVDGSDAKGTTART